MLTELKFVQGAIGKTDFVQSMKHFVIESGFVRAYDGVLALGSPVALDTDCKPHATTLIRALSQCSEAVSLTLLPNQKLRVQSGRFQAFVPCIEEETPDISPTGEHTQLDGEALMKALKAVWPFVGNDASRPWSNGVLLRNQSAFATNNVILAEHWLGPDFPEVNIPSIAVKEMLRIGEPPTHAQVDGTNSISFHYAGGRWIRCAQLSTSWPDISRILDRPNNATDLPQEVFTALDSIRPFVSEKSVVIFDGDRVATHDSPEEGASYEIAALGGKGIYRHEMFALLKGIEKFDFGSYPQPAFFFKGLLRGVIIGMSDAHAR